MNDIEQDLRTRWLPSTEQMAAADAMLNAGYTAERGERRERGVYTTHLLIGKEYGIWTTDIEVVPLDGVFLTRDAAHDFVYAAASRRHDETGETLVGGWAWHMEPGHAAVWDDIMSRFPKIPPRWFQEILDQHGVEVTLQARLTGKGADREMWACMGDCSCWFVLSEDTYIDRYSYVNEAGWCQGQECPCHDLPLRLAET